MKLKKERFTSFENERKRVRQNISIDIIPIPFARRNGDFRQETASRGVYPAAMNNEQQKTFARVVILLDLPLSQETLECKNYDCRRRRPKIGNAAIQLPKIRNVAGSGVGSGSSGSSGSGGV